MKAVVKYGLGRGETELREVPVPKIGDSDILLEVKAAGVCGSDIAFDEGGHENLLKPPVILGHEFSGVIAEKGKNVKNWDIGARVVSDNTGYVCGSCYACSTSNFLVCPSRLGLGYGMDGGFTKYVRIPGDTLAKFPNSLMNIPDGISFEEAAILDPCCNGYKAVCQEAHFKPGDYGAVIGVGPLGLFSIQALRSAGASRIIAIGLKADKDRLELAQKLGATEIIYSDIEDVNDRVGRLTDGEGVALTIDCAGIAKVLDMAIKITRSGGEIVKIGYDENPLGFSLDPVIDKGISIKGHFGYDWISWRNSMNLIQAGKIDMKSMISHKMGISDFRHAFNLVKNREAIKIILYPDN